MRRNPIPILIFLISIAGLVVAYGFFRSVTLPRYEASRAILVSKSIVRLSLAIQYGGGPLVREAYAMSDVDGLSSSKYVAVNRKGIQISITERPRATLQAGPNVAYFFEQTVADGIWKLTNKPPRGNTNARYTLSVYQLVDGQQGSRTMTFTDPHYWATTGGHQFTLHLTKGRPIPDLLKMSSTTLVDSRYEKIVDDFRTFGPASFRAKVAAARVRLGVPS